MNSPPYLCFSKKTCLAQRSCLGPSVGPGAKPDPHHCPPPHFCASALKPPSTQRNPPTPMAPRSGEAPPAPRSRSPCALPLLRMSQTITPSDPGSPKWLLPRPLCTDAQTNQGADKHHVPESQPLSVPRGGPGLNSSASLLICSDCTPARGWGRGPLLHPHLHQPQGGALPTARDAQRARLK